MQKIFKFFERHGEGCFFFCLMLILVIITLTLVIFVNYQLRIPPYSSAKSKWALSKICAKSACDENMPSGCEDYCYAKYLEENPK